MSAVNFSSAAAFALVVGLAGAASAHIDVTMPTPRHSNVFGEMKDAPCGVVGSSRGGTVHTYQPGEVITITVNESVPHPGYMRIAFDMDGHDDFVNPRSIDPSLEQPGGGRACVPDDMLEPLIAGDRDNCGEPDFCHNDTVLLDNLDAVAVGQGGTHTFQVKLPDVECANCTLQIIQVMSDIFGHGYHDPDNPATGNIYYECIDIELVSQGADASSFGEQPATGGTTGIRCGIDSVPANNLTPLDGSGTPTPDPMTPEPDPMTPEPTPGDPGAAGTGGTMTPAPTPGSPGDGSPGAPVPGSDTPTPSPTPMPGTTTPGGTPTAQPQTPESGSSDDSGCAVAGSNPGAQLAWLLPALALLWRRRRARR